LFHKNSSEILSGYFGKLPEFNDFIKYNAGSTEILYVDNWLQDGLAQAKLKFKNQWEEKYNSIPPTGFFIPVPSSRKTATGMLYPGKDKSGREFPFIIFSLIETKLFDPLYLMPAGLERNLSALDEILRREETLYALNNALKNHQAPLPEGDSVNKSFKQNLTTSSVNEFQSRTGLSSLKEKLNDITYQDNSVISISLITDDSHFGFDAGFLIYILQSRINLSYKHSSVFWNSKAGKQHQIFIFPFNLTALNFVDLLSPEYDNERMISIDCSSAGSVYTEDDNLTLEDFLKTF